MLGKRVRSRFVLALVSAFALCLVAPSVSRADEDDPETVAQAKEHYKAGLEAYKAGKYDVAIKELKKAYLLKKLPPLLLNIGATYRKMGDLDLSLHFYQKFLDEAPADAKDRPEVEKIISEIKAQKASGPATSGGDDSAPPSRQEAPPPRNGGGSEWNHTVIDAVPPDMPIDVAVQTAVMKGVKVFVYYRGPGQADFQSVLMKRKGRQKVGRIPAEAVTGRSLQYYIEAKDSAGTVVKSSGNAANPNIVMIEDGVKPVMISSRRDDDQPEEQAPSDEEDRPKKKKAQRDLDDEEAPTTGRVDLTEEPPKRTKKSSEGGLSDLQKAGIGLMAGGGALAILGAAMLPLAAKTADTLSADSKAPVDANNNPIFFNNDPNAGSTQEAALQSRGKTYNIVGIVGLSIGGAAIVGGAACLIADAVMKSETAHPKKKKHKRRRVEEDEEEESWYVAPNVGPTVVGVSGGFNF